MNDNHLINTLRGSVRTVQQNVAYLAFTDNKTHKFSVMCADQLEVSPELLYAVVHYTDPSFICKNNSCNGAGVHTRRNIKSLLSDKEDSMLCQHLQMIKVNREHVRNCVDKTVNEGRPARKVKRVCTNYYFFSLGGILLHIKIH